MDGGDGVAELLYSAWVCGVGGRVPELAGGICALTGGVMCRLMW